MPDIFSKKKRSEIMSKIRGKNTKTELLFRKALSAEVYPKGFRYRLHYKKIHGSPDIVFVKQKIGIFIDGDFWHGRGFDRKKSKLPKKYWIPKIEENIRRDRRVNRRLKKEGWKIFRIWESDARKNLEKPLKIVIDAVKS